MTTFILKKKTYAVTSGQELVLVPGQGPRDTLGVPVGGINPPDQRRSSVIKSAHEQGYQKGMEAGKAAGMEAGKAAGMEAGINSAGVRTGIRNTWNRMGNWGKVGTVAGGTAALIGGGYLMGKGAGLWGNNNKKN